ncbi:MAG TPA: hypothetical protein QF861_11215 [Alphaproteobacteria bacterium]|nr:hypothetical protein [Alphaproteobacteria bacterium]
MAFIHSNFIVTMPDIKCRQPKLEFGVNRQALDSIGQVEEASKDVLDLLGKLVGWHHDLR